MSLGLAFRLAVLFTGVNLAWEAFQLPLYTIWWSDPWSSIIFALVHCTVGDLMIGSAALALALGIAGRGWPAEGQARRRVVTVTTLVGVSYTSFSEWLNVEVRQTWAYTELMPRLPPFDMGLMPVLQWLTLPGLALRIVMRSSFQTSPKRRPDKTSAPTARTSQHPQ